MVWYSHLYQNFPQFIVIHTVKGFGIVNKAEIDVFLELSCFFDKPSDVGNLISGSSAFSKTSLNIWKFMVHILLKADLENFKHYFTSNQCKETEENNRMGKTVDLFKKRQRNQRSNCQHLLDHGKGKRVPEKHLFLLC